MSLFSILRANYSRYKKIGGAKVFIYTMGKVGSSAIFEGLDKAYQLHNFDGEIPAKYFSSRFTPYIRRYLVEAIRWKVFHRKAKKELIKANESDEKIKVISLVRDPVERNISAFFQNLDSSQVHSEDDLIKDFFALTNHMLPLEWFDIEFKRHLNVDIYEHPFDVDEGYGVIKAETCDILLLQLEKLNELEGVIRDFLKYDGFKLSRSGINNNYSRDKWYKNHLEKLKSRIEFPVEYLDLMYNAKYSKKFYSSTDIKEMRRRWKVRC